MSHGFSWVLVNLWEGEPGEEALEAGWRPSGPGTQGSQVLGA